MLSLYLFGVLLWLADGLLIHTRVVATVLKAWKERQGLSRSVAAESLRE